LKKGIGVPQNQTDDNEGAQNERPPNEVFVLAKLHSFNLWHKYTQIEYFTT
jgi:hypothetical protein